MRWISWISMLLMCCAGHAFAQDDKIDAEQPDQSYGAAVLEKKSFQFESSVYYTKVKESPRAIISSSVLRYGIAKRFEIRLLAEQGDYRDVYITETALSTFPLALGTKVNLVEENDKRPGVALVAYVQLPFTNFDHQNSQWSPAVYGIMEKHAGNFTFAVNGSIKEQTYEHNLEYLSTTDIKYELSDKVQVFAEYFGQFESHEAPMHNVDSGLLLFLKKNWQVHVAAGTTIAHHPASFFMNTGFAFKLKS